MILNDIAEPPNMEGYSSRLSSGLSGTNAARAGDYNLRMVLKAIRLGDETTRVELARCTGLAAPTIANITNRLIRKGLIRQAAQRRGGRGQPAQRFEVHPDGAFAIGLNIDRDHLTMVTLDLAGEIRSSVTLEVAFALPKEVAEFVWINLDELISAGAVDRARMLGVGIAIPDDLGRIVMPGCPEGYEAWDDVDLAVLLGETLPWPIHVANDATTAALGEAHCGTAFTYPSFFYLLVTAGLGGGVVIDRHYVRGATSRSGEIGLMPNLRAARAGELVQDTVSLSTLHARLAEAGCDIPDLRDLVRGGAVAQAVCDQWLVDSICALTSPLAAVQFLLDPDAILIGGRLPTPLLQRLASGLATALAAVTTPFKVKVLPATMAQDASAFGAAILPFLICVLPTDAILIKAGRA